MHQLPNTRLHEILQLLGERTGLVGVELGVAIGDFLCAVIGSERYARLRNWNRVRKNNWKKTSS